MTSDMAALVAENVALVERIHRLRTQLDKERMAEGGAAWHKKMADEIYKVARGCPLSVEDVRQILASAGELKMVGVPTAVIVATLDALDEAEAKLNAAQESAKKQEARESGDGEYNDILGFLCLDSKTANAFPQEEAIELLACIADTMYSMLLVYQELTSK